MDIFSKIACGEIPSYKCAENEEFYAFLDISPVVRGHVLVIPRREVDYLFDMDDDEIARYFVFAKKVAKAIAEGKFKDEIVSITVKGKKEDIVIDADWPFGAGKIQNDLTNVSHPNNSLKGLKGISSNAALSSRNVYK